MVAVTVRRAWSPPQRHLLTEDGERAFDGERLAGFSAALARGDTWFLSALFVLPDYQGRRVGRELLDRSWAGDYRRRMTITDSIQPVSTGIYARRGLIPTTPILSLSGLPISESSSPPRALAISGYWLY
jgi:GNAT superfamily N-acetyltransferase